MSFTFSPMFPIAKDNTEYELIEKNYVSSDNFLNKSFLLIQPDDSGMTETGIWLLKKEEF